MDILEQTAAFLQHDVDLGNTSPLWASSCQMDFNKGMCCQINKVTRVSRECLQDTLKNSNNNLVYLGIVLSAQMVQWLPIVWD